MTNEKLLAKEKILNFIDWFAPSKEINSELKQALTIITEDHILFNDFMDSLTIRAANHIKNHNITDFNTLIDVIKDDSIVMWRNMGKKVYEEITEKLKELGKL